MPKSNAGINKKPRNIYMDYASSVDPNPSSIHTLGVLAKRKLENARSLVAKVLSGRAEEIIFTSGGTESNNLAIQGTVFAHQGKSLPHIITTNIEHSSVLETFKLMEKRGLAEVTFVPVEKNGIVDPKKIKKEIKQSTILVSVMYANNEIGTVEPIREIAKEIRHYNKLNSKKIYFHTDAVQAANYLDLNVDRLGVDMLSLSGTKIKGAGRVGVLYVRKDTKIENVFGGGDQELGLRPGTENMEAIERFAKALYRLQLEKEKEVKRLAELQEYFLKKISKKFPNIVVNGDLENRLRSNINLTIPNIPSDLLVIELSQKGIMASAKSACKSSDKGASYVLEAINPTIRNQGQENGSLRFSLGADTTKKDIDYVVEALSKILTKLKKWYN